MNDAPRKQDDPNERRQVWAKNNLFITISHTTSDGVRFEGQDLNPGPFGDEYEYALTVSGDETFVIIEALGGTVGDDPLDLIEANIEKIVHTGEMTWLKSIGITPGFWSHP